MTFVILYEQKRSGGLDAGDADGTVQGCALVRPWNFEIIYFFNVVIYKMILQNFSKDHHFNSKTTALLACYAGIVKKSRHFSYRQCALPCKKGDRCSAVVNPLGPELFF